MLLLYYMTLFVVKLSIFFSVSYDCVTMTNVTTIVTCDIYISHIMSYYTLYLSPK